MTDSKIIESTDTFRQKKLADTFQRGIDSYHKAVENKILTDGTSLERIVKSTVEKWFKDTDSTVWGTSIQVGICTPNDTDSWEIACIVNSNLKLTPEHPTVLFLAAELFINVPIVLHPKPLSGLEVLTRYVGMVRNSKPSSLAIHYGLFVWLFVETIEKQGFTCIGFEVGEDKTLSLEYVKDDERIEFLYKHPAVESEMQALIEFLKTPVEE